MQDMPQKQSYVDDYQPPMPQTPTPAPTISKPEKSESESLESQNIFFLLGIEAGSDEDKESFLDELQQVIWEDFIENDVKMLITPDELKQLQEIMKEGDSQEVQEKIVVFLEKLVPDLEEIMMEKALELKGDLVKERLSGMKEYHTENQDKLSELDKAEKLIKEEKWHQAGTVLNSVKP